MMVVMCCRDPRCRVLPECRLPGCLKQTGVCEGAAGKNRELYNLCFLHSPFLNASVSRLLCLLGYSCTTSGKGKIKLISRTQMSPSVKSELDHSVRPTKDTDHEAGRNEPLSGMTDRRDTPKRGVR